jgi:uncharacterized membrane protein YhaH (DUF805 family)
MGENMSARHYLFGFSGRINRAKIWLFVPIVILTFIVAIAIVFVGFDMSATLTALKAHGYGPVDWTQIPHPGCKGVTSTVAAVLLALLAIAYVWALLAVYAKRLHDRGRTAWWLLVYVVLPAVLRCTGEHHGGQIGKAAVGIAALIGLWVFVDLYCLKGNKGTNKYGADPLDPEFCDPEKPVKGCRPKPLEPTA